MRMELIDSLRQFTGVPLLDDDFDAYASEERFDIDYAGEEADEQLAELVDA